MRGMKKDKATS